MTIFLDSLFILHYLFIIIQKRLDFADLFTYINHAIGVPKDDVKKGRIGNLVKIGSCPATVISILPYAEQIHLDKYLSLSARLKGL